MKTCLKCEKPWKVTHTDDLTLMTPGCKCKSYDPYFKGPPSHIIESSTTEGLLTFNPKTQYVRIRIQGELRRRGLLN